MSETDTKPEAELQRYWNPQGGGVEQHDAGLLYLRDDVDAVIAALAAERDALRAGVERLRAALDDLLEAHESGMRTGGDWGAGDRARVALKGASNG